MMSWWNLRSRVTIFYGHTRQYLVLMSNQAIWIFLAKHLPWLTGVRSEIRIDFYPTCSANFSWCSSSSRARSLNLSASKAFLRASSASSLWRSASSRICWRRSAAFLASSLCRLRTWRQLSSESFPLVRLNLARSIKWKWTVIPILISKLNPL